MNEELTLVYKAEDGSEEIIATLPAKVEDEHTARCEASWQQAVAEGIVEE